jgi:hypothetical protein
VYKQPMRLVGALALSCTLAILLAACPPIQPNGSQQKTCLTDLECRAGQKCRKAEAMVLGYCRDLPAVPVASESDAGADVALPPAPGDVSL